MLLLLDQPSVEILHLRVDEPVTTLTDIILASVCFFAFFKIRSFDSKLRFKGYFKYYFLTLGMGALFGGLLGHGFLYSLSPSWQLLGWNLILLSVACMVQALIELARPHLRPLTARILSLANLLFLVLAAFLTIWKVDFTPVKFYTIFGKFCVVGSLSFFLYRKTHNRGVARFLLAVSIALTTAFIFSYEWGVSPWFNHNDISHLILAICAFIIYKGVTLLLDSTEQPQESESVGNPG